MIYASMPSPWRHLLRSTAARAFRSQPSIVPAAFVSDPFQDAPPGWRRMAAGSTRGADTDVPHGSQRPPPHRAPTAGVWRHKVRPLRDLPSPEPHFDYFVRVFACDPKYKGSLACRWRTAKLAVSRSRRKTRPTPGPLRVTSDRAGPAACPGPSRHRPARVFQNQKQLTPSHLGRVEGLGVLAGTNSTL